jgi:hypothetical protein
VVRELVPQTRELQLVERPAEVDQFHTFLAARGPASRRQERISWIMETSLEKFQASRISLDTDRVKGRSAYRKMSLTRAMTPMAMNTEFKTRG